ncbi:LysR substrate-binding domain-containing protein [Marinobacter sp. SS21]|uniref:LysR substrate-binding domain-containing protein n=1 Tax=Marinobacter sp. SS21 TaxID=2979460 RepID=UPI00232F9D78|nr:LysR substrate-binding domain-containing protein [Marinobacter sp. SS21]MDC0663685.1 LysR substrate-binding domain-containing protein [Marinobacter sp. SS21]
MRSQPPPMQFLPAFEAAARLSSFKLAAEELNVTPSAISQQIKGLEQLLGHPLFVRHPRAVELTRVGLRYFELASEIIRRYRDGHRAISNDLRTPTLRVSAMTLVAYDLLIPALPRFNIAHPNIDLRIETSELPVELGTERDDIAVRVGPGNWPGLTAHKLCDLSVTVVDNGADPDLAPLRPADTNQLARLTLIHSRTHVDDWAQAAQAMGIDLSANPQVFFNDSFSAVAAAEAGSGVALGLLPIIQKRIDGGSLRSLLARPIPIGMGIWLVYPPALEEHPGLPAARQWLEDTLGGLSTAPA